MIIDRPITAAIINGINAPTNPPAELPSKNGVNANKYFIYSPL